MDRVHQRYKNKNYSGGGPLTLPRSTRGQAGAPWSNRTWLPRGPSRKRCRWGGRSAWGRGYVPPIGFLCGIGCPGSVFARGLHSGASVVMRRGSGRSSMKALPEVARQRIDEHGLGLPVIRVSVPPLGGRNPRPSLTAGSDPKREMPGFGYASCPRAPRSASQAIESRRTVPMRAGGPGMPGLWASRWVGSSPIAGTGPWRWRCGPESISRECSRGSCSVRSSWWF